MSTAATAVASVSSNMLLVLQEQLLTPLQNTSDEQCGLDVLSNVMVYETHQDDVGGLLNGFTIFTILLVILDSFVVTKSAPSAIG